VTQSPTDNALLAAWKVTLARRGAAPAVLSPAGAVLRTFLDIEREAQTLEALFTGQPAHSVVAVQIGNNERWPAVVLALMRRNLVVLPLGRHMENAELDLALETSQAAMLVTLVDDELRLTRCAPLITRTFAWDEIAPDLLKLTSGTTSLPRAIRFRPEFRGHSLLALLRLQQPRHSPALPRRAARGERGPDATGDSQ
jgi:hypothetical protein